MKNHGKNHLSQKPWEKPSIPKNHGKNHSPTTVQPHPIPGIPSPPPPAIPVDSGATSSAAAPSAAPPPPPSSAGSTGALSAPAPWAMGPEKKGPQVVTGGPMILVILVTFFGDFFGIFWGIFWGFCWGFLVSKCGRGHEINLEINHSQPSDLGCCVWKCSSKWNRKGQAFLRCFLVAQGWRHFLDLRIHLIQLVLFNSFKMGEIPGSPQLLGPTGRAWNCDQLWGTSLQPTHRSNFIVISICSLVMNWKMYENVSCTNLKPYIHRALKQR